MNELNDEENNELYTSISDALNKTIKNLDEYYTKDYGNNEQYLNTGFSNLYLRKGDLIVLASKHDISSFVASLIDNIAIKSKKPLGYISCGEKDEVAVCSKLLSHITRVPLYKINGGNLKKSDFKEFIDKAGSLYEAPIFIDDSPNWMFEEIEFTARIMVKEQRVELIIIDSFHFLAEIVQADKDELPFVQYNLLKQYKEVSKRLNIPIIILMNLPGFDDYEPSISDFKGNMEIPRTVDQVLLLHKERIPEDLIECDATLITAKNAHGINLRIPLKYESSIGIYSSAEECE